MGNGNPRCRKCGGETFYYDTLSKGSVIIADRYKCKTCKEITKVYPNLD